VLCGSLLDANNRKQSCWIGSITFILGTPSCQPCSYFSSNFLPAFKLSKFKIALNTRK